MKPKKTTKPSIIFPSQKPSLTPNTSKINNPWTSQPPKTSSSSSLGLLSSLIQKHYPNLPPVPSSSHSTILSTFASLITSVKLISAHQSSQSKQLLFDKYKPQFDLISKLVVMNNVIAFINSAKQLLKEEGKGAMFSESYVKVPCEGQATFLKLYYRIMRKDGIEFKTTFRKEQVEELIKLKAKIVQKLYIE